EAHQRASVASIWQACRETTLTFVEPRNRPLYKRCNIAKLDTGDWCRLLGDEAMAVKQKVDRKASRKRQARSVDPTAAYTRHGLQLAILDRGFIYVGDVKTN